MLYVVVSATSKYTELRCQKEHADESLKKFARIAHSKALVGLSEYQVKQILGDPFLEDSTLEEWNIVWSICDYREPGKNPVRKRFAARVRDQVVVATEVIDMD